MDRREFIINTLKFAGITSLGWSAFTHLYRLGGESLVNEANADNSFISGHIRSTSPWSSWDGESQDTLNADYCVFFDTGVASANDTGFSGSGLITGNNLVATQVNNVPASSSGFRQLTSGSSQYMTLAVANPNAIIKNSASWSVFIYIDDWAQLATANMVFYFVEGANRIEIRHGGNALKLIFHVKESSGVSVLNDATTTDDLGATESAWLGAWADGSKTRGGFYTGSGVPTKWSDFGANDRVTNDADSASFTSNFTTATVGSAGANYYSTVKIGKLVIDSSCLIDNAS